MTGKTIFKRIIDGEIPARIIYDDDVCIAFHDVNPQAPVHALVIPKKEIPSLAHLSQDDAEILGHMMLVVSRLARELGLETGGYRVVVNSGPDAGQSVDHLHLHLLGGRLMGWPPG